MTGEAQRRSGAAGIAFRVYKVVVSPVLHALGPGRCVYMPTCSEYAYTAVNRFGVVRGSWMALGRLARCHPWSKGGFDPVPERETSDGGGNPPHSNGVDAKSAARSAADRLP